MSASVRHRSVHQYEIEFVLLAAAETLPSPGDARAICCNLSRRTS